MCKKLKKEDLTATDLRAAILAYLIYDQKMSANEAQGRMHPRYYDKLSAATAGRDKLRAEDKGWTVTRFKDELFEEEVLAEIRHTAHSGYGELEKHLRQNSGDVFQNLKVFYSGNEPLDQKGWDRCLREFGERASGYIGELLSNASVVGMGWGTTVGSCILGMALRGPTKSKSGQSKRHQTVVFPTAGESLGNVRQEFSSSNLASMLSKLLNGSGAGALSLNNVPPIIPDEFKGADRAVIVKFLCHFRNYNEIFGDGVNKSSALIGQCDTMITSVGHFHQWTELDIALLTVVGINPEELTSLCKGDIGGALVEKDDLSEADLGRFNEIEASWTGASLKHYQQIAGAAANHKDGMGPAGVIVCATGATKSAIIHDLITRKKAVNQLIVGHSLANELSDLCHIDSSFPVLKSGPLR